MLQLAPLSASGLRATVLNRPDRCNVVHCAVPAPGPFDDGVKVELGPFELRMWRNSIIDLYHCQLESPAIPKLNSSSLHS